MCSHPAKGGAECGDDEAIVEAGNGTDDPTRPHDHEGAMNRTADTANRPAAIHEMHGRGLDHPQDTWVVNMEATAALLIAFGSLLAFAASFGAIPEGGIAEWAIDCLFPMQFPLFYFASGYLYQRYRSVRTRSAWMANLRREAVILLVPFAVFTVLALAASTVTGGARVLDGATLLDALLARPMEPLGYLYTSLILYAITPTVISRRNARGLLFAALACKLAIVVALSLPSSAPTAAQLPYAVVSVAENWIWFATGMAVSLFGALPLLRSREKAWALGSLWIAASVITFIAGWLGEASYGLLDAIGVVWFASLFSAAFRSGAQDALYGFASRYTMALWPLAPLGLKLTIVGLTALGITASGAPWLCFAAGLVACFGLPVLVMALLERVGKLGFLIYPARYLPPAPALIERKGVS